MPGLVRAMAWTAVVAGTPTAASNPRVAAAIGAVAAQDQPYEAEPPPSPAAAQPPEPADPQAAEIDQLQQLAALREQGVLTEEDSQPRSGRSSASVAPPELEPREPPVEA